MTSQLRSTNPPTLVLRMRTPVQTQVMVVVVLMLVVTAVRWCW